MAEFAPVSTRMPPAPAAAIDSTSYTTLQVFAGQSLSLDPDFLTAAGNDVAGHWCASTIPYASTDRGTPGTLNQQC